MLYDPEARKDLREELLMGLGGNPHGPGGFGAGEGGVRPDLEAVVKALRRSSRGPRQPLHQQA